MDNTQNQSKLTTTNPPNTNHHQIQKISQLTSDLELLYKELEIYQKENNLLKNYIKRIDSSKKFEEPEECDLDKEHFSKLSLEEKYEISILEEDFLKKNIEDSKKKSEIMMETLKAVIEETDMSIKEIRKEAMEFQRDILVNQEFKKIKQIDSNRLIKFRKLKIEEKDNLYIKMEIKKNNFINKIKKIEKEIKKKVIGSDDLKFIDFHQLKIENKKFSKEKDKKNIELQQLKILTASIMEKLNKIKKNLKNQLEKKNFFLKDIDLKKIQILNGIKEKEDLSNFITKIQKKNDRLAMQKSKMDDNKKFKMKIGNFIQDKDMEKQLVYSIKNLKRKHEVIDFKWKDSVAFLKKNGIVI